MSDDHINSVSVALDSLKKVINGDEITTADFVILHYLAGVIEILNNPRALGRALLAVERAKASAMRSVKSFEDFQREPMPWPEVESPAAVDEIWNKFAEQGPSGQVAIINWSTEASILLAQIITRAHGAPIKVTP